MLKTVKEHEHDNEDNYGANSTDNDYDGDDNAGADE